MNSVRRSSSSTSLSVMTVLSITTATRSTTAAAATAEQSGTSRYTAAGKRKWTLSGISEGLSDGEEELKMAHTLDCLSGRAEEKLLIGALQAVERWRIDTVS